MSAVIEAKRLSKWFKEVVAVNNLDIEIEEGVTGLLGPNGAGKSTLIRLILGLHKPSRGAVRVYGEDPRNNLAVLRHVGYCPEIECFFDGMTGLQFVTWLNRYSGIPRKPARTLAIEACRQVGMESRMGDPITSYSQGMRQRIRIAQALAADPDLLILDEPMAGLDPEGREEMFALVKRLGASGKTVIVSSHILYEIERVTNNIVLLHGGRILARGPVQHIRALIDEHPHTVTLACDRPHEIAARFAADAATLGIHFEDGRLVIQTAEPAAFYERLTELAAEDGADVTLIQCADDNLQSVFNYLVKG